MLTLAQQQTDLGAFEPLLFYGFSLLIIISAWAIVLSQNIVRMAVYLLLTLSGGAGMYFMLEAEFLAAVQLIVYAGGTLILIIFGVMLTSKNPFMRLTVPLWEKMVAVAVAMALAGLMIFAVLRSPAFATDQALTQSSGYEQVQVIGTNLLSTHLVPFEIAAVLLLVVMVAAAYMARRRASA